MNPISKVFITTGILFILIGVLWQFGGRFLHFGRMPGDIVVERENFRFYFPIVTCLVLSGVLSLIGYFQK
ncbi:DUF2905 domain-containing protein [Bdellovibrionota bacterium FG-2]